MGHLLCRIRHQEIPVPDPGVPALPEMTTSPSSPSSSITRKNATAKIKQLRNSGTTTLFLSDWVLQDAPVMYGDAVGKRRQLLTGLRSQVPAGQHCYDCWTELLLLTDVLAGVILMLLLRNKSAEPLLWLKLSGCCGGVSPTLEWTIADLT
ncbi:hypothetical protein ACLKA6_008031 [Drosophila palustris]